MWRKLLCILSSFMLCTLVAACGSSHRSDGLTPEQVQKIQRGKTTKAEVRAMFGEPTDISIPGKTGYGYETWSYLPKHSKDLGATAGNAAAGSALNSAIKGTFSALGLGRSAAGQAVGAAGSSSAHAALGNATYESKGNDSALHIQFSGDVVRDYSFSYSPGK